MDMDISRLQVDLHAAINVGRDLQHGNMHGLAHDAVHLKKGTCTHLHNSSCAHRVVTMMRLGPGSALHLVCDAW